MFRRSLILLLALVLILAACGGSSDDESSGDNDASADNEVAADTSNDNADDVAEESNDDADPVFVLSVTGAQTFDFEAEPIFGCAEDQMSLQTFTQSPTLFIGLPADVLPGTYPLADFDANASVSYVDGAAVVNVTGEFGTGSSSNRGAFYFQDAQGELVIEAVPTAPGERFAASLDGQLADRDGETISFTADFDFMTNSFNFLNCQFADAG